MNITMSALARFLLPILADVPETHPDYPESYQRGIQKMVDLARERETKKSTIRSRDINGVHVSLMLTRYIDESDKRLIDVTINAEISHPHFRLYSGIAQIKAGLPEAQLALLTRRITRDGSIPLGRITIIPEGLPEALGQLAIARINASRDTLELLYDTNYQTFTLEQVLCARS